MTFNYNNSAATALKLITKFGASATLIKRAEGSYNPATASSTVTESNYTVQAVLLNYKANETNTADSLISAKDRKVIMQATTVIPDVSDSITFNSVTYRIIEVKTLSPAGTAVLHELRVTV